MYLFRTDVFIFVFLTSWILFNRGLEWMAVLSRMERFPSWDEKVCSRGFKKLIRVITFILLKKCSNECKKNFFEKFPFKIIILFDNLQLYNVKLNDQLLFRLRIKKGKGILRRAKLLTSKTVWFIP